jgi:sulfide:quinone oxidoreductase
MAHIVIMGAGLGGMPMAYELREGLDREHRITVVSNGPKFQFVPSNPWVAVNWRTRDAVEMDIGRALARKNVDFSDVGVKRVHPAENRIELNDGSSLDYDFLVIATGPRLAFEEVEGLGPKGYTHSICTLDHAVEAAKAWEEFVKDPGPIVVGAVQGASCFGPAYEFAMIMDTDLRNRKIRDRVPITMVTPEPYIGHLGLGGVGDSKGMIESMFRERHVKWVTNAKTTKVEAGAIHITECDEAGQPKKDHTIPFKYSMMLPAFKGVDAVIGIEGLTNPRGFILIDEYQRNPKFKNIYSVGVCVAIAPVEATPLPCGAPKTGYMIETMVTAASMNIQAAVEGKEPEERATWNALCLADFGDTGVAFVALPQMPPRNVNWFSQGKWVHMAKIGFERYFMTKMKRGTSEPVFEKLMMNALGIIKLKGK